MSATPAAVTEVYRPPTSNVASCPCGYEWKLRGPQAARCPACGNKAALKVNGEPQQRRHA
jgi:hypothetical protein